MTLIKLLTSFIFTFSSLDSPLSNILTIFGLINDNDFTSSKG